MGLLGGDWSEQEGTHRILVFLVRGGAAERLGQPDGGYGAAVTSYASARRRLPMALDRHSWGG